MATEINRSLGHRLKPAPDHSDDAAEGLQTGALNRATASIKARQLGTSGSGRRRREAAGATLEEIASCIPVDPSTLSRWERGVRTPRSRDARLWAKALDRVTREM
jgi:DNA-binding transcriptional regulator YiaG